MKDYANYVYDASNRLTAIQNTVDGVGYTGHVMDPVTGLTYM